jgi:aspartyl/asparaginyl beta-hydroxylase (cupin superfamily)
MLNYRLYNCCNYILLFYKMDIILKLILLIPILIGSFFLWPTFNFWTILPIIFVFGLIDVSRHKTMNFKLIKEYFIGKGILTFILSPLNLFTDLLSHRNLHTFKVQDLPQSHQNEINEVTQLFDENAKQIAKRFNESKNDNRTMLFYKWYGYNLDETILDFNKEYKYIKTIGVSLFREKTSTSRHFGPLRATYRILYNFNKVKNEGSYIEADGRINKWKYNPLFIFDDTLIHQSFNEEDDLRYCAFIDILRPSYFDNVMKNILALVGFFLKKTRGIFYKNWKMI